MPKSDAPPPAALHAFLAERYRASPSHRQIRRESIAARAAARRLSRQGRPVELIGSLLVPKDETVFLLFRARSVEDVAAVADLTEQRYDRISEGVAIAAPRASTLKG